MWTMKKLSWSGILHSE